MHMDKKTDLTKTDRAYYTATARPALITFPPIHYLAIDGQGDPASAVFAEALQTLYPVAYAVKFLCKAAGNDFTVPKLEGLWWFDGRYDNLTMSEAPQRIPREAWHWKLMVRMPDFVTAQQTKEAISTVATKKKMPQAEHVSYYQLNEGKCVQILHTGPFDREPETLREIEIFTQKHSLAKNGHHHEIYLSDMRKTAPARLRTILREPVK